MIGHFFGWVRKKIARSAILKCGVSRENSAQFSHELVVYTLLRHGADASIADENGKSPEDLA